jgi:hypothetical protein
MKVSDFKALPNAPDLPAELQDDDLIEDYLIRLFIHGARAETFHVADTDTRKWKFYIDQNGAVRGEVKLPVAIDVSAQV